MASIDNCFICKRIRMIKDGTNPYFIKGLTTGYVVLGDHQFYKGYTLFLCKKHVNELHELDKGFRRSFLDEMGMVAEAVYRSFNPVKLNYELLGNGVPHLHQHLFPRYHDDPKPNSAIWIIDKKIREAEKTRPSTAELIYLKKTILKELELLVR